jgi:hypothetical protein
MTLLRWICVGYVFALGFAAVLNYIPGITDAEGRSFGIFSLDIYDDALHLFSAAWAGIAAWMSHKASKNFLFYFGALYLGDGLLGLITGSGYLDLGIISNGFVSLPFTFKIFANTPHIALGGVALFSALFLDRKPA